MVKLSTNIDKEEGKPVTVVLYAVGAEVGGELAPLAVGQAGLKVAEGSEGAPGAFQRVRTRSGMCSGTVLFRLILKGAEGDLNMSDF